MRQADNPDYSPVLALDRETLVRELIENEDFSKDDQIADGLSSCSDSDSDPAGDQMPDKDLQKVIPEEIFTALKELGLTKPRPLS